MRRAPYRTYLVFPIPAQEIVAVCHPADTAAAISASAKEVILEETAPSVSVVWFCAAAAISCYKQ